jgi:hypothetical protein
MPIKKHGKMLKQQAKHQKLLDTAVYKRFAFKLAYVGTNYFGLEG